MNNPEQNPDHARLLTCFGNFVRKLRMERGEKLYSVSSSLGVTHPVISKVENGTYHSISAKLMMQLLAYYKVGIVELLTYLLEHMQVEQGTAKAPNMQDLMREAEQLVTRMQQIQRQTG